MLRRNKGIIFAILLKLFLWRVNDLQMVGYLVPGTIMRAARFWLNCCLFETLPRFFFKSNIVFEPHAPC